MLTYNGQQEWGSWYSEISLLHEPCWHTMASRSGGVGTVKYPYFMNHVDIQWPAGVGELVQWNIPTSWTMLIYNGQQEWGSRYSEISLLHEPCWHTMASRSGGVGTVKYPYFMNHVDIQWPAGVGELVQWNIPTSWTMLTYNGQQEWGSWYSEISLLHEPCWHTMASRSGGAGTVKYPYFMNYVDIQWPAGVGE